MDGGGEVVEESDVFAVDVDVDEAAELSLGVEEALADAGVLTFEIGDEFLDGAALGFDGVAAGGEVAEGGGDCYGHGGILVGVGWGGEFFLWVLLGWGGWGVVKFAGNGEWRLVVWGYE